MLAGFSWLMADRAGPTSTFPAVRQTPNHGQGAFMRYVITLLLALIVLPVMSAQTTNPNLAELNRMAARFAPTPIRADISGLTQGDREALPKLIEAARILNTVFMRQLWSGNVATYDRLKADKTPLGQARAHYYWLQKGPWSDLD